MRRAWCTRSRPRCQARPQRASARMPRTRAGRSTSIDAGEFADPRYRANPVNRCYFCKHNLYGTIATRFEGTILSGTNTDDLGDFRPGLKAADEHRVRHPFVEAGLAKSDVRALARELRLDDLAELPAAPCLSSRVETGIAVEPVALRSDRDGRSAAQASARPRGDPLPHRRTRRPSRVRRAGPFRLSLAPPRGASRKHRGDHQRRWPRARRRGALSAGKRLSPRRAWLRTVSIPIGSAPRASASAKRCSATARTRRRSSTCSTLANERRHSLLLTRLTPEKLAALASDAREKLDFDPLSRTAILDHGLPSPAPAGYRHRLRRNIRHAGRHGGAAHARLSRHCRAAYR